MKKILLLVVFLICINSVYANLKISEVMYNPSEDENYNEWIEVYNDGNEEIDLNLWRLCNKAILSGFVNNSDSKEYNNESTILLPSEYGIISDGKSGTQIYNNLNINGKPFHVDSASLCGGLSNSGDSINLTSDIQNINLIYENLAKEDYSIEFYNDKWYQSLELGGTPGKENNEHSDNENLEKSNDVEESQNEDNTLKNENSNLKIIDIDLGKDNKSKFGDSFMVKINVFKGDTSKYSISLYAQDKEKNLISKKTKFNVYDKNKEYTLSLPIQLIPNCNNKYKDGEYDIILEGLDALDTSKFSIEGLNDDLCIKEKQECKNEDYNKTIEDLKDESKTIEDSKEIYVENYEGDNNSDMYLNSGANINYESKDKKLKNLAVYFLIFVLIMLSVYLLIQNERAKNHFKSNH